MYRNTLLYVIEMLRDMYEMCYICVRGKGDTCKIAKRYVMYFGILARIGKRILGGRAAANLKKWREIRGEIMAGNSRGFYGWDVSKRTPTQPLMTQNSSDTPNSVTFGNVR
jgi:hypothetical protein